MIPKSFKPQFEIATDAGAAPRSRAIRVTGELDNATSDALNAAFEQIVAEHDIDELVLDLHQVSFVDSSGMRSMIILERAAAEHQIRLVLLPPPDQVTELLRIAGVADRLSLVFAAPDGDGGGDFSERVELELARDSLAPSAARAEIREALSGLLDDAEMGNAVLLTSELVTNAVLHPHCPPSSPITMRITTYKRGRVRVDVEDGGGGFDPSVPKSATSGGGQGLFLVDRCAARWGAQRANTSHGPGFRVWFEFGPGAERADVPPA